MAVKITSEKDLLNIETRKALIDEWNDESNQRRKAEAFKAYECLKDKTINYVYELLSKQFEPGTVVEMQYAMTNVSILRKVIDKLAKVYANGVKRTMPEKQKPVAEASPTGSPQMATYPPAQDINGTELTSATDQAQPPAKEGAPIGFKKVNPNNPLVSADLAAAVDPETQAIEDAATYLCMNHAMKKTNRYYRTFKNCLAYVRPRPNEDNTFDIGVEILPPHHYDVVESPLCTQEALAIVISDYTPRRKPLYAIGDAALAARTGYRESHVVDAPINSTPNTGIVQTSQSGGAGTDAEKRQYIWWSKSYHFTTNGKGEIINNLAPAQAGQVQNGNPILRMPFVNFAGDQDSEYWAEGGTDLVDAGIKINVDITNAKHVGVTQGYGQLYMTGKNLPKSVKVGPTHCVQVEYDKDQDPTPEIGYLQSNPPLDALQKLIEMQVALMLTTNNLSTSGFSVSLQGGKDFASGVALMIDKSESIEDINEQAEIFIRKEPEVWIVARDWFKVYAGKGLLSDKAKSVKIPENVAELNLAFPSPKPVMSEAELLANIKLRKDLGLNTEAELLMRDDPSLTEQEAQEKLAKIKSEKQANMATFGLPVPGDGASSGGGNGDQSQKSGGVGDQNNDNAGPVSGGQGAPGFGKK